MFVLPAVDLRDGRCVRLMQGDPEREDVFSEDPVEMARHWQRLGAGLIHVVDLDGALEFGDGVNHHLLTGMLEAGVRFQLGGGIRRREQVQYWLERGVERIILGTAALADPSLLGWALETYGDRILVAVDTRDGAITTRGWTTTWPLSLGAWLAELKALGVKRVVVTDSDQDGTLSGPNLELFDRVLSTGLRMIAAGGVGNKDHLESLYRRRWRGLEGAIVGRALYTQDVTWDEVEQFEGEKPCF